MKNKLNVILVSIAYSLFFSCNSGQIETTVFSQVTKNDCGLLVFADSIRYNIVYDFLETKEEAFENTTSSASIVDEEKPLTDFETLKNHSSYRNLIKTQEDIAENNGIDLSVNPVPEILDDDEILQTFLNKDRMMVIDNTIYFYYDDCTLIKFPIGKNCKESISTVLAYFNKYDQNIQQHIKPTFYYEKTNICNDEENYRSVQNLCQEIALDSCVSNICHPEVVDFYMNFPHIDQSSYILKAFKYQVGNDTEIVLNPNATSQVNINNCGWTVGSIGYPKTITFPSGNTQYTIKMTAKFAYYPYGAADTCTQTVIAYHTVPAIGCAIGNPTISISGFIVSIEGLNNVCNTPGIMDSFNVIATDGNPTVTYPTPNSVKLVYSCGGDKEVKINYNQGGCITSKKIIVTPIDPSLCCSVNNRIKCEKTYLSSDNVWKVKVKLKERHNRLVGILKSFKNTKRHSTTFNGEIKGPVHYYKNSCDCEGDFDFSKTKGTHRKKMRIKFKFRTKKADIEALTGVSGFYWFKHNWSRKNQDPWKLLFSTTQITTVDTAKINCSTTNGICDE